MYLPTRQDLLYNETKRKLDLYSTDNCNLDDLSNMWLMELKLASKYSHATTCYTLQRNHLIHVL
jgi:hypothetical protein